MTNISRTIQNRCTIHPNEEGIDLPQSCCIWVIYHPVGEVKRSLHTCTNLIPIPNCKNWVDVPYPPKMNCNRFDLRRHSIRLIICIPQRELNPIHGKKKWLPYVELTWLLHRKRDVPFCFTINILMEQKISWQVMEDVLYWMERNGHPIFGFGIRT